MNKKELIKFEEERVNTLTFIHEKLSKIIDELTEEKVKAYNELRWLKMDLAKLKEYEDTDD